MDLEEKQQFKLKPMHKLLVIGLQIPSFLAFIPWLAMFCFFVLGLAVVKDKEGEYLLISLLGCGLITYPFIISWTVSKSYFYLRENNLKKALLYSGIPSLIVSIIYFTL